MSERCWRFVGGALGGCAALWGCSPTPGPPVATFRASPQVWVEARETARAGPYRLRFDSMGARASYHEWGDASGQGTLDITLPATLTRPKGDRARLRLVAFRSDPKGVVRGGASTDNGDRDYPEVPFQADVPPGWRGDRLTLGGEFQEIVVERYAVRIGEVAIERIAREGASSSALPAFRFTATHPQTLSAGAGVTVRVVPTRQPSIDLPIVIEWDSRRALPSLPKERAELESLTTNVGSLQGHTETRGSAVASAMNLWLVGGPGMDADPHEIRLNFTLVKARRHFPFSFPARLTWGP